MSNLARTNRGNLASPFDKILNDFFGQSAFGSSYSTLPAWNGRDRTGVDHMNYDDRSEVYLTVPGFHKDEVSVTLENDTLTIEGNVAEENELAHFWSNKSFKQAFSVSPHTYEQEKISATLQDGILTVIIPKLEKAQPKRIEVKIK